MEFHWYFLALPNQAIELFLAWSALSPRSGRDRFDSSARLNAKFNERRKGENTDEVVQQLKVHKTETYMSRERLFNQQPSSSPPTRLSICPGC
jgi:hypothetical protein